MRLNADMAELADALDLESCGKPIACILRAACNRTCIFAFAPLVNKTII